MKNIRAQDRAAYSAAKAFLLRKKDMGITERILNEYLKNPDHGSHPKYINDIYLALLKSAQNAERKSNVIGKSLGRVERLGEITNSFDPVFVKQHYQDWEPLFEIIRRQLKPRGKMNKTPRGIWPGYCRTIISGARFLSLFSTVEEFYKFVEPLALSRDERTRLALPILIDKLIHGFGFALACDFLKQIGYKNYGKADVHIKKILKQLNLCDKDADDYQVTMALFRIARNARITPHNADKLFWLIGSGYFYKHKELIGKNGKIGSQKKEFFAFAKEKGLV